MIVNPFAIVLIAESEDGPVGYSIATILSEFDREYLNIVQLYSKQGYDTKALIERLEKYAIDNGIKLLGMSVNNGLPEADKMGFKMETSFFVKRIGGENTAEVNNG